MVCIYCGNKTSIVNSRLIKKSNQKWRRHKCLHCNAVFTSIENYQLSTCLLVQGANNKTEPFSVNRLFLSIYQAVSHLKNSEMVADELTQTIINQLTANKPLKPVIPIKDITSTTLSILKRYNAASAVYYASLRLPMPLTQDVKRVLKEI